MWIGETERTTTLGSVDGRICCFDDKRDAEQRLIPAEASSSTGAASSKAKAK
jgi:hypothetical protein